MNRFGRVVLLWMIPLHLVLIAWVWFGRLFLGAGGWFMVIMTFTLVPVLVIALFVTTLLGYLAGQRPRALTSAQATAQVVVWAGMLVFGFFMVDGGDTEDSIQSVFTRIVGSNDATQTLSMTITGLATLVTIVGWIVLLVLLVAQKRQQTVPAYGVPG